MEWTDAAVVLGSKPFGESKAIAELFARSHGRTAGVVHGGGGRRAGAVLQAGNLVRASWKARLGEQLGAFALIEVDRPFAATLMQDSAGLAALTSAIALLRGAAPERQGYPLVFDALVVMLEAVAETELWPAVYCRFELGLLAALGYGLDLDACAVTGAQDDLVYVSPRTGRAASRAAGAPYADRLLVLPAFLTNASAPIAEGDVADAFALVGYFLERRVFDGRGEGLPPARRRLIEVLGHAGRL